MRPYLTTFFGAVICVSAALSANELGAADTPATVAKEEAVRIENKVGGPNQIYDAAKLEAVRKILVSVQQDPQLVALKNQLVKLNAKSGLDSAEERLRVEEALAAREKELVLERQPGLKSFIEARDKLQKEMKESVAARNATPEAMKALAQEMKAREDAAKKKQ